MNAEVGHDRTGWERVIGKFGSGTINDNGTRLLSLATNHGLKVTNSFFQHKRAHTITWNSNAGNASKTLDFLLVRGRFFTSVHDVRVRRGTGLPSDHELVIAKLQLHLVSRKKNSARQRKFDVQRLNDFAVQQDFKSIVRRQLPLPAALPPQADAAWSKVQQALNDAGVAAVGFCKPSRKRRIISARTVDLAERKRAVSTTEARKRLGKLLRYSLDNDERAYWRSIAAEMEDAHLSGNSKKLFAVLKRVMGRKNGVSDTILDGNGEIITDDAQKLDRWAEHFRHLLNKEAPDALDQDLVAAAATATADGSIETGPPTAVEIRRAIESLKPGKAAGPDNHPPEFFARQRKS